MILQDFVAYWEYNLTASTVFLNLQVAAFPPSITKGMYIGSAEYGAIDNIFTRYSSGSAVLNVTTDPEYMTTTISAMLGFQSASDEWPYQQAF